ncbi:hypothetical protein JS756_24835 [Streptomyces actuosus]|uniref:Secreted protein n=1 Tax=Streptomyces actuosus TaxID=1885 RepID=A0ABS2VVV6_STRAS|nr:hypothetical protein [Streptomyces actuosus]
MVEVAERGDLCAALLLVQCRTQVEHVDLVLDVEAGGGLVPQQRGLLGRRRRDPHALPLPAGQLVDVPVGEFGDTRLPHRLQRQGRAAIRRP